MSSQSVRFSLLFLPACSVSRLFSVRHIPSWVPYLSYKPLAQKGRNISEKMKNEPFEFVKNALVCVIMFIPSRLLKLHAIA
jgi:hypothetical protein